MESYGIHSFVSGYFHVAKCFLVSPMLLKVSKVLFFIGRLLSCGYSTDRVNHSPVHKHLYFFQVLLL